MKGIFLSALIVSTAWTPALALQKNVALEAGTSISESSSSEKCPWFLEFFFRLFGWKSHTAPIKVKAFYIDFATAEADESARCMERQLETQKLALTGMGIDLSFQRLPFVALSKCKTVAECMEENPQCFPSKSSNMTLQSSGRTSSAKRAHVLRADISNWCSYLKSVDAMVKVKSKFDHFLVLKDDVILSEQFPNVLQQVLATMPRTWALTAFDSIDSQPEHHPFKLPEDMMSASSVHYSWGTHPWLLNAQHIGAFSKWLRQLPALPVHLVTKMQAPPSFGIQSDSSGSTHQTWFLTKEKKASVHAACLSGDKIQLPVEGSKGQITTDEDGDDNSEESAVEVLDDKDKMPEVEEKKKEDAAVNAESTAKKPEVEEKKQESEVGMPDDKEKTSEVEEKKKEDAAVSADSTAKKPEAEETTIPAGKPSPNVAMVWRD